LLLSHCEITIEEQRVSTISPCWCYWNETANEWLGD